MTGKIKTKTIAIRDKTYDFGKPKEATQMAKILKSHVVKNNLYTDIKGKNYAHVEGWQFAGGMLGLYPRVAKVERLDSTEKSENKWFAEVEIIRMKDGEIMSRGFALCSSKEANKKDFDEYAVLSMAQTRAIGKAYRNLIGWVMKLSGYESTPAEEMSNVGTTPPVVGKGKLEWRAECHGASKSGCPDGADITKEEVEFSKKVYGKSLCRKCQKLAKPKKK